MKIERIIVGRIESNVYIYYDEDTKEAVMFDCGDDAEKIIAAVRGRDLCLKAIFLTHGHFDHILAAAKVRDSFNVPVYASKNERELLINAALNRSVYSGEGVFELEADKELDNGEVYEFSGHKIKTIYTPGHTFGSVCYYDEQEGNIFTGDTLFLESIGRSDFVTGDYKQIIYSISKILFKLPDSTAVFPGHGPETSIGYEKKHNPFVRE